jgi:hypothetical protein
MLTNILLGIIIIILLAICYLIFQIGHNLFKDKK